jgi:hypothetical protein
MTFKLGAYRQRGQDMRTIRITLFLVAGVAALAYGWGTLLTSYPCPGGSEFPNGVAYRSSRLYVATNWSPLTVWQVRPNTGSVYASHPSPATSSMGCTAGLAGETVSYWVSDARNDVIYQVGYLSGSVVNSFASPGTHPMGLAFRNATTMYHTDFDAEMLYVIHPVTGSVASSYPLDFGPCDLDFDAHGYLWIADGFNRVVRQCDLTGSTLASFSVESYGFASGLAYYGQQLWVGINAPIHSILKFEVDPTYAVEPASIGKVKALYR